MAWSRNTDAMVTSLLSERFKFWLATQNVHESLQDWKTRVWQECSLCDYGDFTDEISRDKFVFGLQNKDTRAALLKCHLKADNTKKTLSDVVAEAKAAESIKESSVIAAATDSNYTNFNLGIKSEVDDDLHQEKGNICVGPNGKDVCQSQAASIEDDFDSNLSDEHLVGEQDPQVEDNPSRKKHGPLDATTGMFSHDDENEYHKMANMDTKDESTIKDPISQSNVYPLSWIGYQSCNVDYDCTSVEHQMPTDSMVDDTKKTLNDVVAEAKAAQSKAEASLVRTAKDNNYINWNIGIKLEGDHLVQEQGNVSLGPVAQENCQSETDAARKNEEFDSNFSDLNSMRKQSFHMEDRSSRERYDPLDAVAEMCFQLRGKEYNNVTNTDIKDKFTVKDPGYQSNVQAEHLRYQTSSMGQYSTPKDSTVDTSHQPYENIKYKNILETEQSYYLNLSPTNDKEFPLHSETDADVSKHESELSKLLKAPVRPYIEENSKCVETFPDTNSVKSHMLQRHKLTYTGQKPNVCSVCHREFYRGTNLRRHMKTHTDEKPHACSECGKRFKLYESLTKHIMNHKGDKPHRCSHCGRGFSESQHLDKHMLIHTGEKHHVCPLCDKGFTTSSELKRHMTIHTGDKPHGCSRCGKRYRQLGHLNQHLKTHAGKPPFICPHCSESFPTGAEFEGHMLVHAEHSEVCSVCNNTFADTTSLNEHMLTHKPNVCPECDRTFKTSEDLEKHMPIHSKEKSHLCSVCDKGFSSSEKLKAHVYRAHSTDNPNVCSTCGKRFLRPNELKMHMRIHTGERPFKCPKCAKAFTSRTRLHVHKQTHDKSFMCTECGKMFPYRGPLIRHMETHGDERSYKCSDCGKCFKTLTTLKRHERIHTNVRPHACTECSSSFIGQAELRIHMRSHTGEKPCICSHCGKGFARPDNLRVHIRTHTGEKPYVCSVCEEGFHRLGHLTKHMAIHKGETNFDSNSSEVIDQSNSSE